MGNREYIGQIFGDWEVIEECSSRKLKCRCITCGYIKNIDKYSLSNGVSWTCKHEKEDKALIGSTFNDWKVLGKGTKSGYLKCRCSCGIEKEVSKSRLLEGRTKSCGHGILNDLTGKKFGRLTVIKYIGDRKWECQCDCGNTTIKLAQSLEHANEAMCDICRNKQKENLSGQIFNDWTVIENLGNSRYRCKCTCGNESIVTSYMLKNGLSKSCGHGTTRLRDIKGQKFGELTALEYLGQSKWLCECSCGNLYITISNSLRTGERTSCGCKTYLKTMETRYNKYGEICLHGKDDSIREKWQIDAVLSEQNMRDYITNLGYKPTTTELSKLLGINNSNILKKIHEYSLEDIVDIKTNRSQKEKDVLKYIQSIYNGEIIINSKNIIYPNELDIYLPELKIAIEFNGNYWHSAEIKGRFYHRDKSIQCLNSGIRLIHIFEYEWDSNPTLIKKLLYSSISENNQVIYGRKTEIREIELEEAKQFIINNHTGGYAQASINLGCLYNGQLIGVMTFGKPRFDSRYDYELIRLCWDSNYRVIGGFEKLFRYFINKYSPKTIISYCDFSKFNGESYIRLGFKYDSHKFITDPGYVWWGNDGVVSRYKAQKRILVENGLGTEEQSEGEIMTSLGYIKIYNSGNLRFTWEGIKSDS